MIACPVCNKANEELQTVCVHCGSFLQGRVEALDLFATLWGLVESPRRTFTRIVLSRHKNYVLLLSMLFGVGLVCDVAWAKHLGNAFGSLTTLATTAVLVGPPLGVLSLLVLSFALRAALKVFGGKATLRNMFAVSAYAMFPLVASLVFIVPLEVAVFGMDFFGTNPPPMLVNPAAYMMLLALKALTALYAMFLLVEGTMVANGFTRERRIPVLLNVVLLVAACMSTVHWLNVR